MRSRERCLGQFSYRAEAAFGNDFGNRSASHIAETIQITETIASVL